MSRLEAQIQPMLSRVIKDGESMYFSKKDINRLAAFTFKNAVIANYFNPTREPFFTRATREIFRTDHRIPPSVAMWFARLQTPILTGMSFGYILGLNTGGKDRTLEDLDIYVYTFAIGHFVLQLLAFRFASLTNRGRSLPRILPQPVFWDDYSMQFWPNTGKMLRWPPLKQVDEEMLSIYTHRWAAPVRFQE